MRKEFDPHYWVRSEGVPVQVEAGKLEAGL